MRRPIIVAEIGASHNQSLTRALDTISAAAEAGATLVKLQTYTPETMVAADHVLTSGPWKGRNLKDLYAEAHTPWEWHSRLFEHARRCGIHAFSTPFDETAVHFLEHLDCPIYKVASFEITDLHLIRTIAQTRKDVIISTGMASAQEISNAILAAWGSTKITLLKCTSAYPAPIADMNLYTIKDIRARWGMDVGLSDHTHGNTAAIVATAMGATIIEKHITLDHAGGPDDAFAMLPHEFAAMVKNVHDAADAVGGARYGATESEHHNLELRRALYAVQNIEPGDPITHDNVKARRPCPAIGICASELPALITAPPRLAAKPVTAGTPLQWFHIAPHEIVGAAP